ncbi:hypothetical protein P879_07231 [Paragonimus westermani]|uniref:Uncharacterized protein n=1 Tax=Paragonimus westermani TaxID=34504 RepID=A0A8T0DQP6_9TREM|nr:hypothetical protein P879_07231 [Paragonimus westermani]
MYSIAHFIRLLLCTLLVGLTLTDRYDEYMIHGDEAKSFFTRDDYNDPTEHLYNENQNDVYGTVRVQDEDADENQIDQNLLDEDLLQRTRSYEDSEDMGTFAKIIHYIARYGPTIWKSSVQKITQNLDADLLMQLFCARCKILDE